MRNTIIRNPELDERKPPFWRERSKEYNLYWQKDTFQIKDE
jgi:hypothetical protein